VRRALGALALSLAAHPAAGEIRLAKPIDCTLGETCFIQQYVDHDPGPGAADFTCGPLAYDGHDGTDFALPSLAAMQAGVDVLAAAPGRVVGRRDSMPDIASNAPDAPPLDGRDCGNGVLLDHDDGWQTQYCHLRRGSVAVQPGDAVARGAVLGQVGLSGRSEFPHLHLTVRRGTEVIDPFLPDPDAACGTPVEHTLWLSPIDYVPGGLIALGFSDEVPDYQTVRAGLESRDAMGRQAPAMVLWGYAFGARAGDEIAMRITGPEGVVAETAETLDREQAQFYRAAGRRLTRTEGWPPGIYRGEVRISRDGAPYSEAQATLHISR
jgi:hypothetical protein